MFKNIKYFLLISLLASCVSNSEMQQKENDLLKKEVEEKNAELRLQSQEDSLQRENDSLKYTASQDTESLADEYDAVKKSIFLIYTTDNVNISQGSAFVIDSNGDAISNYHVFENASIAIAVNSEGKKFVIDKIYTYDKGKDYIIFRLGPGFNDFNPVKIASNEPRIGEECFAVGNPYGLTQTLSSGIISGYREENHLIQTTTPITHGSSGGALFNKKGEVIGITSSGIEDGGELNFAININDLPLDSYSLGFDNSSKSIIQNSVDDERASIENVIRGYYSALVNRDYNSEMSYLNDSLSRYYDYYNIPRQQVFQQTIEYNREKGIIPQQCNVDWNSITIVQESSGFAVSYNMIYIITRSEVNKPTTFNLQLFIELNNDLKITSIYENILNKY